MNELEAQFKNVAPGDVGVMGDPIEHSLSPAMHNAAFETWKNYFKDKGKPLSYYHKFRVPVADLDEALKIAREKKMMGLNVTVPLKIEARKRMDDVHPFVNLVGSINTIRFTKNQMVGYNTDAEGFERALYHDLNFDPEGKTILLLGAGGTGRVMAFKLNQVGAKKVYWWNRTPARVREILTSFPMKLTACDIAPEGPDFTKICEQADLVVNSTSVGLSPSDGLPHPDLTFHPGQNAYDVIYHRETEFLRVARKAGAVTAGGLGMLVYQGGQSFNIWTSAPAPIEVMRQAVKDALKKENKK